MTRLAPEEVAERNARIASILGDAREPSTLRIMEKYGFTREEAEAKIDEVLKLGLFTEDGVTPEGYAVRRSLLRKQMKRKQP